MFPPCTQPRSRIKDFVGKLLMLLPFDFRRDHLCSRGIHDWMNCAPMPDYCPACHHIRRRR
jgi:hypothetical protein